MCFLAIENVKGGDLWLPSLWFVECWQLCKYSLNEAKFEGWQPFGLCSWQTLEVKGNKVLTLGIFQ